MRFNSETHTQKKGNLHSQNGHLEIEERKCEQIIWNEIHSPCKNVNSSPLHKQNVQQQQQELNRFDCRTKKAVQKFLFFREKYVGEVVSERKAQTHCTHMCCLIDSAVMIKLRRERGRERNDKKERENYEKCATLQASIIYISFLAFFFVLGKLCF